VLRASRTSGLVRNQWEMFNQKNEQVMQMEGYGMSCGGAAPVSKVHVPSRRRSWTRSGSADKVVVVLDVLFRHDQHR